VVVLIAGSTGSAFRAVRPPNLQVQVYFGSMPETTQYIRAGTLRPLAVTTATRAETLPELPIVADYVPGYEASSWYGVGAPKSTPTDIIQRLNTEINGALAGTRSASAESSSCSKLIACAKSLASSMSTPSSGLIAFKSFSQSKRTVVSVVSPGKVVRKISSLQ
jgi:hypothetical protein